MSVYVLTGLPVAVGGAWRFSVRSISACCLPISLGNKLLIAAVMLLGSGIGAIEYHQCEA